MNDKLDFTTGSISKKLISFMLPVLAAMVLQSLYGAVDLLIVGQFGTTQGVSGVATGSSIMHFFMVVVIGLSTGVTVVMGQYIGQGKKDKLDKLINGAFAFFFLFGIIMSVLIVIFAGPLALLMQAPEEAVVHTTNYIRICGCGFVFIAFYNFLSSLFRGMGDSRTPLIFVAVACLINIAGDILLVAVFQMNEIGAAWATIAAQACSVIMAVVIIMKKKNLPFRLKRSELKLNSEIKSFFKVGFPLAVQDLLTNFTFLLLCAFINRIGLAESAGYGVAHRIQSFVMLIPSSIMQSMASFVAQNVGARREDRAREAMKTGMLIGASIGVVIMFLAAFCGEGLSSIFTKEAVVAAKGGEYLRGFAPEAIVTSILFSFLGYFNGHSWSKFSLAQGLAQSFIVRLPMSYFMSIQPGISLAYIGMAAPSATCFGIVLCLIYYMIKQKQLKAAGG